MNEATGITFCQDKGYFYLGDELYDEQLGWALDDFWVGPNKDFISHETLTYEEVLCQKNCIDHGSCYAYSVKVEHPMKGQCYLKGQPAIGSNGEYTKSPYNENYNSARISPQAFKQCWSNAYQKKAVFDPNMHPRDAGCWAQNPEADENNCADDKSCCYIANTDCIYISCANTKMTGFVRAQAFHDDDLVDEAGLGNDKIFTMIDVKTPRVFFLFTIFNH